MSPQTEPEIPVEAAASPDAPSGRPARELVWPAIALTLLMVGPVLFLIVLLEGLVAPSWSVSLTDGARRLLSDITPHVLVLVIGTLIGVAEVAGAFPRRPASAVLAPWGTALVLANALGTVVVFSAVTLYMPSGEHPILRPIAIALAFAVVIRTRFVLARPLDESSSSALCSLDLGWPYGRLQRLCRDQVRRHLGPDPASDAAALRRRYPSAGELRRVGRWALDREAEEGSAGELLDELDRLLASDVPDRLALDEAAEHIVAHSSADTLRLALGGDL